MKYKLRGVRLEGDKFSSLTVKEWIEEKSAWLCTCECGKETYCNTTDLKSGKRSSCGCVRYAKMEKTASLCIGKKYKLLTCVRFVHKPGEGGFLFCECACGKTTEIQVQKWGVTKSCGCYQRTANSKNASKRFIDHTGQKFGMLTAKEWKVPEQKWLCLCDCGKEKLAASFNLRSGEILSCGCLRKKREQISANSIIGKKSFYLTALDYGKFNGSSKNKIKCRCKCKNITYVEKGHWGITKSCGCLQKFAQAGENSPTSELTNEQAKLVRSLYKSKSGFNYKILSEMFSCSYSVIVAIVKNRTYKNI